MNVISRPANLEKQDNLFVESSSNEEDEKDTPFDPNIYAVTKTVTKGLLNVALLTTNANQLKITIENGPEKDKFYTLVITLSILSIFCGEGDSIVTFFISAGGSYCCVCYAAVKNLDRPDTGF